MLAVEDLAVSLVAFDGYPFEKALESVASIGFHAVEPAIIQGYVDPFDEDIFSDKKADEMRKHIGQAGLTCEAFSAHVDLGAPEGKTKCLRRIRFAAQLGAKRLVTNAAMSKYRSQLFDRLESLAREAEQAGVVLCLENPGDGNPNVLDNAQTATEFIRSYDTPWVRLNYDPGNLVTHDPSLPPHEDASRLGPGLASMHIKDAYFDGQRWRFTSLGSGSIDYAAIFSITDTLDPVPNYSLELPLRLSREAGGKPFREETPVPLETVEHALRESLEWFRNRKGIRTQEHDTN